MQNWDRVFSKIDGFGRRRDTRDPIEVRRYVYVNNTMFHSDVKNLK